jgi:LacI family transcriptional regulator
LAGPSSSSTGAARREAFSALSPALGFKSCTVIETNAFTVEAGVAAATELWSKRAKPTAIFAANDLIALGALEVLRTKDVSVPADVSLVGHNDMPLLEFIDPPLTTVRIATAQMSRAAALMLIETMTHPGQLPAMQVLSPQLVVRKSTAPARR